METTTRLVDFYNSLGEYQPTDTATWQLAQIFNALLAEVKKTDGDDPIVAAIQPSVRAGTSANSRSDCGTLRAATSQLRSVLVGN